MPDESSHRTLRAVWRDQPVEEPAVELEQILNRRAQSLEAGTRSEILASIGAALVLLAVIAWRFAPAYNRLLQAGFAAVLVWVGLSLYRFRRLIHGKHGAAPDALAAPGLVYYRSQLESRRKHLKNAWIWHGPLLLGCLFTAAALRSAAFPGPERLPGELPLLVLLVLWTAFSIRRRFRQAAEIRRELAELDRLGGPPAGVS